MKYNKKHELQSIQPSYNLIPHNKDNQCITSHVQISQIWPVYFYKVWLGKISFAL